VSSSSRVIVTLLLIFSCSGCSSELAVLFENGPYTVAPGGQKLLANPSSWNRRASVIYVDSPVGTGFSYLSNPNGYVVSEKVFSCLFVSCADSCPPANGGRSVRAAHRSAGPVSVAAAAALLRLWRVVRRTLRPRA
jgi:hypothetical protein